MRTRSFQEAPRTHDAQRGFTLIELVVVVLIVIFMSSLVVSRIDALNTWRQRTSLRKFVTTWEFLAQQAQARGESYRLVVDIDRGVYFVRREVPVVVGSQDVDHVAGLRLDSEKQRLNQKQGQQMESLQQEYAEEDARQGDTLESLFYSMAFRDPESGYRLGVPLDFPSLKNETPLNAGLHIRDIEIEGERQDRGQAVIRFTSRGTSNFTVIHFLAGNQVMTASVNPANGRVTVQNGDVERRPAIVMGGAS